MRAFALEQLAAAGELEATMRRHATFFVGLAEQAAAPRLDGPDGPALLSRLELEHDLRLDTCALADLLEKPADGPKLFAYPAQSNFSGVRHSLEWVTEARRREWDVLLDAAALVPTSRLDLSQWHPDFVPLSFYKMFGYPTGLLALVARRTALDHLRRPWYAGGTTTLSSVSAAEDEGAGFYLTPGIARFEEGTVNFLSIPGVEIGPTGSSRLASTQSTLEQNS